jgi:hypothetical protein
MLSIEIKPDLKEVSFLVPKRHLKRDLTKKIQQVLRKIVIII